MVKNVVEEIVTREYERMKPSVAGFCGCDVCRADVLVYALNRVKPRYVSRLMGEVLTNVSLGSDQSVADVAAALVEGFRRVKDGPRTDVKHTRA